MNELQLNLYNLAADFDKMCKENGIQYFLAGGTALGTVRNHCFLPWDDDIDFYITRDNWNKLKNLIETNPDVVPKGRSLIYNDNTKYYYNPIPRFVDNNTTAIYHSQVLPAKACGQHIELLIMDPMPNDPKEREQYIEKLQTYTELMSPYFVVNKNIYYKDWKKHYRNYNKYYKKAKRKGLDNVLREMEQDLQKYKTEDCKTFCMRWGIDILMYEKEDFGQGRPEMFELQEFPVATHAENIFRIAYGDSWMYIPVNEEQVVHNALQNLAVPYENYTKEYLPLLDREQYFKSYTINKHSNAKVFYYRRKMEASMALAKAKVNGKVIADALNNNLDELAKLLNEKNYSELGKLLAPFLSLQSDGALRTFNAFVPVSDEVLNIVIRYFVEQGKYYAAKKFITIRENQDKPLSKDLQYQKELIGNLRNMSIALYDHNNETELKECIEKISEKNLLDLYRAKLWIMKKENKDNCYKAIIALADEALELYPFDGELMYYKAYAVKNEQGIEAALPLYEASVNNTRNGIIWDLVKMESGVDRIAKERDIINGVG